VGASGRKNKLHENRSCGGTQEPRSRHAWFLPVCAMESWFTRGVSPGFWFTIKGYAFPAAWLHLHQAGCI